MNSPLAQTNTKMRVLGSARACKYTTIGSVFLPAGVEFQPICGRVASELNVAASADVTDQLTLELNSFRRLYMF
jgi:hypothetical protein